MILIGLIIVFWKFIISDQMIHSTDLLTYGVFFRHFLGEYFLTNLSIPDWNPYVLGGLPFVDSIHGATFYPLQWLDILIGGLRICVYNFMLHYLMAGIFTYLAVRQLLLSRVAAAVAGVSYMFAPCLISWVAPGHDGKIYVAALFPLAMLFLIKMFRTRPWFNATLLGLTIAAIIFTAHLQMAYYSFLAIGFYILWQLGSVWHSDRSWRSTFKPILIATYAVLLGLIISSIQLLPSYDYFSNYSLRSQQLRGLLWAGAFAIRAEELISQIVPEFSGFNKVDAPRNYWGKNSFKDNSESVGLVPILLALVGLAFGRSRQKLVWALMAFLAMIYALGPSTPFFESIIRILPFADSMRGPSSISFVFCFCAAVLAAYGVHELWFRSGRINTERYRVRAIRIILIGLPLLFAVLAGLCLLFGEQALALYCQLLHSTILPGPETDPHKWQYALNNLPSLREGFILAAIYSACFSAIVYKALTKAPLRRVWLVALVPLIMFASGSFSSQFVQLTDQTDQSSSHKSRQVVSVLKQGQVADRVIMLDLNTSHYRLANHEIQTPQGISPDNSTGTLTLPAERPAGTLGTSGSRISAAVDISSAPDGILWPWISSVRFDWTRSRFWTMS